MQIKVCGLRNISNIQSVLQLPIDYIGLIFYEKSPRFVVEKLDIPQTNIRKVGVFVNASLAYIKSKIEDYDLDCVQLHGTESVEFCRKLSQLCAITIFKAISISSVEDVKLADDYDGVVDVLLFDTKVATHGGSGVKFDWDILQHYMGNTPFLLSGGISIDDVETIRNIKHPQFLGVDVNSKFELSAGYKDVSMLDFFTKQIQDIT